MAQNMYRVGDYVYFETSSSAPYQIRRIEELNKTSAGNVEAKVLCYYRRREIPRALLKIADRAERIDDRSLINTRRHININTSRTTKVNGDIKNEASSDEEEGNSTSNERNEQNDKDAVSGTSAQREDSDSPKPMQVDTGEDDAEEGKAEKPKSEGPGEEEENEEDDEEDLVEGGYGLGGLPKGSDALTPRERHHLRQHELFLSRQVESLPATHIRGKCSVTLLSEVETPDSYLGREDAFFYSLVYDQSAMTLLADKGEIRVGEKFQCEVPEDVDTEAMAEDSKVNGNLVIADDEEHADAVISTTEREVLVYHPYHNLTDRDIDQFLIIARAVGTFSRALDTSSSVKLPSLHMTAAAASRDVTLLHAMALLHQANYDLGQAVKYLVPPPSKQHYPLDADKTTSHNTVSLGGPILCRDQMEEWSAAEANLFEEAIEKYHKDFNDIRADYLPWKSIKDIIEYYYMWKTTNRYVELKKSKAIDQESKLKQVYIPNYNKPNPNLVGPPNASGQPLKGTTPCESCQTMEAMQWYGWGPAQMQMRVCSDCWTWWKKNGGLKRLHKYEAYDLDGAATQDMLNPAQQATAQKTQSTTPLNSGSLNRSASAVATPTARNGGIAGRPTGGQVIARIAPQQLGQQKSASCSNLGASATPKTRVAFFLHSNLHIRIARRLAPKSLLNIRRSARRPFLPVNAQAIRQYCAQRQPIEIIRAAKQLKRNKLSDAMLAQFASALTSNGAHHTTPQQAQSLKRPLSSAEKSHAPAKRQQHQAPQSQHNAQMASVASSHPQTSATSLHQTHAQLSAPSTSKKSHTPSSKTSSRVDVKPPLAPMVPLPTMPGMMVPSNLAAMVANAALLTQQQLPRQFAAGALKTAGGSSPLIGARESASVTPVRRQPDSRYVGVDEKLLFLAGPRLKILRKRICSKRTARRIALHPCRASDFINKQLPNLQSLFT